MSAPTATWTSEAGIPVRNLWFLLVHASGLAKLLDRSVGGTEGLSEIPDLVERLLATSVERRLRRGLGRGYVQRSAAIPRVRGRIDWLRTATGGHLMRGQVWCRYDDLTHDTPRNRLARAALRALATRVSNSGLRDDLRALDWSLAAWGVSDGIPTASELQRDAPGLSETDDRLMVEASKMALNLWLPAEAEASRMVTRLERDERLLRRIFESGIAGYLRHHLHGIDAWTVRAQRQLKWPLEDATPGLDALMPSMQADIVLERHGRRIVVDTKFTGILASGQYGVATLKSGHIYQLYAYLRSQEGADAAAGTAEGLLLYPSLDRTVDEAVTLHGHRIRFATIDLMLPAAELGPAIIASVLGAATAAGTS